MRIEFCERTRARRRSTPVDACRHSAAAGRPGSPPTRETATDHGGRATRAPLPAPWCGPFVAASLGHGRWGGTQPSAARRASFKRLGGVALALNPTQHGSSCSILGYCGCRSNGRRQDGFRNCGTAVSRGFRDGRDRLEAPSEMERRHLACVLAPVPMCCSAAAAVLASRLLTRPIAVGASR